jgi:hypothetical protein
MVGVGLVAFAVNAYFHESDKPRLILVVVFIRRDEIQGYRRIDGRLCPAKSKIS